MGTILVEYGSPVFLLLTVVLRFRRFLPTSINQILSLQTSKWFSGPEDWKRKQGITLVAKCKKARKFSKLFLTLASVRSLVFL